jgi:Uncharacterised protein family (UPF0158)
MKTLKLTSAQITDIANKLNDGCDCFIHRKTLALIAIPYFEDIPEDKVEGFEATIEKIENNPTHYLAITQPEDRDLFYMIESFIDTLASMDDVKPKLQLTLKNRKPIEAFLKAITKEKKHDQLWNSHVQNGMVDYVKECIEHNGHEE